MKEFIKSILNYYAAFTETRFSGKSALNYKWTNDSNLTLDISFFPAFRRQWIDKLHNNDLKAFEIRPGQYKIEISPGKFRQTLETLLSTSYNFESLKDFISKEAGKHTANDLTTQRDNTDNTDNKDKDHTINNARSIYLNGLRAFNLELRKTIDTTIRELQKEELTLLEKSYRINTFPPLSFNLRSFTQNLYDNLQKIALNSKDKNEYYRKFTDYFHDTNFDLPLFDLYYLLKNYASNEAYGTVYLFFDSLKSEKNSNDKNKKNGLKEYPIFFIEVTFDSESPDAIRLTIPRDIVLLNTPAINLFEFEKILSLPRASSFKECFSHLQQLAGFLATEYKTSPQEIITADQFYFHPGPRETLPFFKFRLGFQVVKNEDKRLLDYSELMTRIEKGLSSKVENFVDVYVNKNVLSSVDDVENSFRERYPGNSSRFYLTDNPLPLNTAQKRILMAIANSKNKIIVVGGPPGTGKSHTIAAITYWANRNNKSVIITSHKKEALDVVDRMLTDKFRDLHQDAKPSIIRLTKNYAYNKVSSLNEIDNSLSMPAIDAATARVSEFRKQAVESDKTRIKEIVDTHLTKIIERIKEYPKKTKILLQYLILQEELKAKKLVDENEVAKILITQSLTEDFTILEDFISTFTAQDFNNVSLENFTKLYQEKQQIPQVLEACDKINRLCVGKNDFTKIDVGSLVHFDQFKEAIKSLLPVFDNSKPLAQLKVIKLPVEKHDIQDAVNTLKELKEIAQRVDCLLKSKPRFPLPSKKHTQEEQAFRKSFPALAKYWKENRLSLKNLFEQISILRDYILSLGKNCSYTEEFLYCLLKQEHDFTNTEAILKEFSSLKFKGIFEAIALLSGKDISEISLAEIVDGIKKIEAIKKYSEQITFIRAFQETTGTGNISYEELFGFLDKFKTILKSIVPQVINALNRINNVYALLLKKNGVDFHNLATLFKMKTLLDEEQKLYEFVKLHAQLCTQEVFLSDVRRQINEYNRLNQKLAEYGNDVRLKNLNNYRGDVERIKLFISKGKRLPLEQARLLLANFACIIAEPEALFKYFPMEEDLIDLLIFDEASQVSIAHSISLILRAKQVVVFGDDYQYGAVSAVNVNKKYAGSYFKKIIDSYQKEFNAQIAQDSYDKLMEEETREISEDEQIIPEVVEVDATKEWIKTFSIRNSTLSYCRAMANYHTSLTEHFRSYKEIIDYSNEFFYKKAQIPLVINRLRTKPINEVLRFIKVETQGNSGKNVNIDELEAIKIDIENKVNQGFKGTIGIITSFREQQQRAEEYLRRKLDNYHKLKQDQKLTVWFVGDVQGEERDIVYYSLVQDIKLDNAHLRDIYPKPDGIADDIKKLKMQRLNVGFSRAKDTMVFVHSMDIEEYTDSRLGDALKFYWHTLQDTKKNDYFISDESVFESPKEKDLYNLFIQTDFYRKHKDNLRIIPQFKLGKYIAREYQKYIPNYRVDFLITLADGGKEKSLVLEYDGLEYHTKDPQAVKSLDDFREEYLEYDLKRKLELESYGYHFLSINKFSLLPKRDVQTAVTVLNDLLEKSIA